VAATSQFVFVSQWKSPIRRFDRITGKFIDWFGEVSNRARLHRPESLAVDEKRDWLFASDRRSCVLRYRMSSGTCDCQFGRYGRGDSQLIGPGGIRLCGDSVWIADVFNKR